MIFGRMRHGGSPEGAKNRRPVLGRFMYRDVGTTLKKKALHSVIIKKDIQRFWGAKT